jgi:hypothetical protein
MEMMARAISPPISKTHSTANGAFLGGSEKQPFFAPALSVAKPTTFIQRSCTACAEKEQVQRKENDDTEMTTAEEGKLLLMPVLQAGAAAPPMIQRTCTTGSACTNLCGNPGRYDEEADAAEAAQRAARRHELRTDPAATARSGHGRRATNLERLARENNIALTSVNGLYVDNDLESGGMSTDCGDFVGWTGAPPPAHAHCVFFGNDYETEADTYLTHPDARMIAGYTRSEWLRQVLSAIVHEVQHIDYDAAPHAVTGTTCTPTSVMYTSAGGGTYDLQYFLSELSAIIAEFVPVMTQVQHSTTTYRDMMLGIMNNYRDAVENCDEGIRGILRAMRCHCSCNDVDLHIMETVNATAAARGWTRQQKDIFRELMIHNFSSLNWPRNAIT